MSEQPHLKILNWEDLRALATGSIAEFKSYHHILKAALKVTHDRVRVMRNTQDPKYIDDISRSLKFIRVCEDGLRLCKKIVAEFGLDSESVHEKAILRLAKIVREFAARSMDKGMHEECSELIKELEDGM